MYLLTLPNELLLQIAENLDSKDLLHFLQANSFLSNLFLPLLHKLALHDKDNRPALFWAACKGYEPLVALLISRGADVNFTDQVDRGWSFAKGTTALHLATMKGSIPIIKLLVAHGANTEAQNEHGTTPFSIAVNRRKTHIARLLARELGANPNALDRNGLSALHRQCSGQQSIEMVRLLLDVGADVNIQSRETEGNTALHYALSPSIGGCSIELLQLLLEGGADVNARNHNGETPLFLAASSYDGSCQLARELLDAGANVNLQSNSGYSALSYALAWGGFGDAFQLLMDRGADVTLRCRDSGDTALHIAARRHDWQIFKCILRSAEGIDIQNISGETVLLVAAKRRNGSTAVIRLLLEMGADSGIQDLQGGTLLHLLDWKRTRQLERWSRLSGRGKIAL